MRLPVIIALIIYAASLFGYHYIYFWFTEKEGINTKKGRIQECVSSWISRSLEDKDYLLVVHQIRNIIMAITFLATLSVILIGFLLGYMDVGPIIEEPSAVLPDYSYPVWVILGTLIFSILNFMLSLRYFTQLTYLLKSSPEKLSAVEDSKPEDYLKKLFVIGNREYTMGRRSMIYALVGLFWFLDVWLFIFLTVVVTFMFAVLHDI